MDKSAWKNWKKLKIENEKVRMSTGTTIVEEFGLMSCKGKKKKKTAQERIRTRAAKKKEEKKKAKLGIK